MAKWKYTGFTSDGKKVSGDLEVSNEKELRKTLRSKGIRPTKMIAPTIFETNLGEWLLDKGLARPFGPQELLGFTRQLSIMVDAGVPILEALEILFKQQANPSLKASIRKIAESVGSGKTLSDSMAPQKGFNKLYCNMIAAGEKGGALDVILKKLSIFLEKNEKTKKQIKSALMYPSIVTTVGAVVITIMMVFVVPQFVGMLKEANQEIPWITQFVINVSDFFRDNLLYMIVGTIVGFFAISNYIKTTEGKKNFDIISMKAPIFGQVIIKGNLSNFARTLATMLTSGVSLIDSLEICVTTIDNTYISKDIAKVKAAVENGKTLVDPLLKIPYFPVMVSQMVKVGEQTGSMDSMLEKIAEVFEGEVDEAVESMTKMIEPLIIVVLGGIVAVILVAMYLPIFMSAGGADS